MAKRRSDVDLLGQFPWNVSPAVDALERSTMSERLCGPADVVLPSEEQVASGAQVLLVLLPNAIANLHEGGRPTPLLECLDDP